MHTIEDELVAAQALAATAHHAGVQAMRRADPSDGGRTARDGREIRCVLDLGSILREVRARAEQGNARWSSWSRGRRCDVGSKKCGIGRVRHGRRVSRLRRPAPRRWTSAARGPASRASAGSRRNVRREWADARAGAVARGYRQLSHVQEHERSVNVQEKRELVFGRVNGRKRVRAPISRLWKHAWTHQPDDGKQSEGSDARGRRAQEQ
jgi:hypothetical protein